MSPDIHGNIPRLKIVNCVGSIEEMIPIDVAKPAEYP
jgi:hypothetical protein